MATELVGTTLDNKNTFVGDIEVELSDSPSIDAFSRLRVSNPVHLYDSNFTYTLNTLTQEAITAESGASITHDATNSCALMTFSSTPTGGKAYMQSYQNFRYQSGRSHLIFMTFNFIEPKTNVLKFVGYGNRSNGVFLEQSGSTIQFKIYSTTDEASETVAKTSWNLDKMDGFGASGVNLDFTKAQILVIDLQWLGVGRARVGFDVGGAVIYAHEFNHANSTTVPYMKTASLPVSAGMTCTGTVSTTMRFICSSVISEGGEKDVDAINFSQSAPSVVAASGARTHMISIRPKTTFNSVTNRVTFIPDHIELLVSGNQPVKYELCIGDVITGTTTFADVNATHSAMEYNTAGTTSGTPSLVIDTGYATASATSKGATSAGVFAKIPITLNAAGAVRADGTLTLLVTGIGGTSACQAEISWKEVR